jgi:hypothetical protein
VTVALSLALLLSLQAVPVPAPGAAVPPVVDPNKPPDPADSSFAGEAGVILVTIKPTAILDYELAIHALQEALFKDTDAARKAATKGWRVFKASTPDATGNAVYIHVMLPAVPGFDYRPSLLVDTLVKELAPELLSAYRDSFAVPPSKLDLTELANMAIAPLPLPDPKTLELEKTILKKPEVKKPEGEKPEVKKPEVKKPG